MFSQFRNVVEGLAQPRLPQPSPRRSGSLERASSLAERRQKARLEDRLRASFTIGDVSNPSTPPASSRVSPAPQFVAEHPLSVDHPLSPAAIPLPNSPPPNRRDSDHDVLPLDPSLTLPDPLPTAGSSSVIEPEPINQRDPPESLPTDPPITSQVPEQSPAVVSEEDTEGQDTSQSILTPEIPITPQVPEQTQAVSEEDTGGQDTSRSILTPEISHDQDDKVSNASVVETTHEDHHESGEVPLPAEESQSEHSASADVESLQERLNLMEQRFTGQWRPFSLL